MYNFTLPMSRKIEGFKVKVFALSHFPLYVYSPAPINLVAYPCGYPIHKYSPAPITLPYSLNR